MINICEGCGGSSSPSNPLISLNEENREGEEEDGGFCEACVCVWGVILKLQGHSGHGVGNEMKEKESSKRGVGCHIQGLCIPRCCKLSLELFSVASLVSVFSIFMAVLIKHQYERALCGELQAVGCCSLGLFADMWMITRGSGECYAECEK